MAIRLLVGLVIPLPVKQDKVPFTHKQNLVRIIHLAAGVMDFLLGITLFVVGLLALTKVIPLPLAPTYTKAAYVLVGYGAGYSTVFITNMLRSLRQSCTNWTNRHPITAHVRQT